jgi:uncharacterized protein YgiM (DUF1202 family)
LTTAERAANLKKCKIVRRFDCFYENLFLGDRKMQSRINLFILICLAGLVAVSFAQEAAAPPEKPAPAGTEKTVPSFPHVAEITGDDVNIRSGPGTNYYRCGKLNKADRVKVVGSQFSWSRIVPPAGSFSWISKQYVSIDANNPTVGIVTGSAVRIYAGSEELKPIHSTTVQLKFNRGDKVKLMGEEKGDYYKIAAPAGTYLWVSTQYTKPLGPVSKFPPIVKRPKPKPKAETPAAAPAKAPVKVPVRAPVKSPREAKKLKEYYALTKQIQIEQAKPMAKQNYSTIKKALAKIAGNKEAGRAARYSEFTIKQIERFELALAIAKEVPLQNSRLQQIQEGIDKARTARLAEVPDMGKFAVIGQFQTSHIYGPDVPIKHYRILDDSGKTVCYALPSGSASQTNLSRFAGREVGLVGTIEPHQETAGALVRFTEIVELK